MLPKRIKQYNRGKIILKNRKNKIDPTILVISFDKESIKASYTFMFSEWSGKKK